jgi:hypothetical protein
MEHLPEHLKEKFNKPTEKPAAPKVEPAPAVVAPKISEEHVSNLPPHLRAKFGGK